MQRLVAKKREERAEASVTEKSPLLDEHTHSQDNSELVVQINVSLREGREEVKKKRLTLLGLTWVGVIVCFTFVLYCTNFIVSPL